MNDLQDCLTPQEVKMALNKISLDLNGMYNTVLSRLDRRHLHYITPILQWLAYSRRPLQPEEINDVLAVDLSFDPAQVNLDNRLPDINDILTICKGLISIEPTSPNGTEDERLSKQVTLSHSSVKEFLLSSNVQYEASIQKPSQQSH